VSATEAPCSSDEPRFIHEAVFYSGEDDLAAQLTPFILDAVRADEPVLVAVGRETTRRLRDELGAAASRVEFADIESFGRNPGRIIGRWHDFLTEHGGRGRPVRGIGEPVWPTRSAPELDECHRHEALLNVAFDDGPGWWLLCPYDTSRLADDVLSDAHGTHPIVRVGGHPRHSDRYPGALVADPFQGALPDPGTSPRELEFGSLQLADVRRLVGQAAHEAGLDALRRADLVLAVSEVAANSVAHGGGAGRLRLWREGATTICEVRDRGVLREPLVGRIRPDPEAANGRGVWFAHTLCDLVQMRTGGGETVVRLQMSA
jgi:anti-sigma regulatory factor (Ser/Thr protein kinase)